MKSVYGFRYIVYHFHYLVRFPSFLNKLIELPNLVFAHETSIFFLLMRVSLLQLLHLQHYVL